MPRYKKKDRQTKEYTKGTTYRWQVLKRDAQRRDIPIHLTPNEAQEIMSRKCVYCSHISAHHSNSLDRLHNDRGYSLWNVVPCCSICNQMKWTMSVCEFVAAVANICDPNYTNYACLQERYAKRNPSYLAYKNACSNRPGYYSTRCFSLTPYEFDQLCSGDCYYCGRRPHHTQKNGIDRRDNKQGYKLSNCVSCCSVCNYMKKQQGEDEFKSQCYKIWDYSASHLLKDRRFYTCKVFDKQEHDLENIFASVHLLNKHALQRNNDKNKESKSTQKEQHTGERLRMQEG
jgi:hypothetical protein